MTVRILGCPQATVQAGMALRDVFRVVADSTFPGPSPAVVLDLILIPRFGIEGSAVATTLAYGVSAVLVLLLLQFRLRTGLFQFAFAGAPVLAASLCFLLVDGGWFYVAAPATAAASVVALVRAFGLFQRKDEMFLRELRQSMPFRLGAGVSAGK